MTTIRSRPDSDQVRVAITRQLIESLKSGNDVPWHQPWTPDVASAMPANILTKLPYRDINPILLRIAAAKNGYRSRWWGTEREWKAMGGRLKPGAKGCRTFQHHDLNSGPNVLEPSFAVIREVTVYNLDIVEGDFDKLRPAELHRDILKLRPAGNSDDFLESPLWEHRSERGIINVEAERIIKRLKDAGADIRELNGSEAAYYRSPADYIVVPMKVQFDHGPGGPEAYYSTVFHEMGHFTETRLGWVADPRRSVKDRYALGELRAEICSAYLCATVGMPPPYKGINHGRYLSHWLRMMGEDSSMIFRIARAASEAADYILGHAAVEGASAADSPPAQSESIFIPQAQRPASKTPPTGQMELSFFTRGSIPPTPESRSKYLEPKRPESPYYGFVGHESAVKRLIKADFDALGRYNHLCQEAFALTGQSKVGKTDLARRHAKALALPFVELSAPAITSAQDILEAMKRVCAAQGLPLIEVIRPKLHKVPPITVFVDDADCLDEKVVGVLREATDSDKPLMQTETGFTVDCHNVHWLIALVDRNKLPQSLRARFIEVRLS